MQKNNSIRISSSILVLVFSFLLSVLILGVIYIVLKYLGVEESMNRIDRTQLVSWRHEEFNPKRYFKLFYNLSLIFIPIVTILLSMKLSRFFKKDINLSFKLPKFGFGMRNQYLKIEKKISPIKNFLNKNHLAVAMLLIFVVLFNFGYLLETGIWINYYHHNFIIATINDLFAGKHLLVDTYSQYGMLLPFVLYKLFQFVIPFSYMNLYFVFMVVTMIYYFFLYFFLLRVTQNKLLCLFGLFIMMGVTTLFNYPTYPVSENYVWPGATVLRYFLDIPVFYLLYKNKNLSSTPLFVIACFLTTGSVLYNLETGLALSIGLMSFTLFASLSKYELSLKARLIFFLKKSSFFLTSLVLVFVIFSIYTLAVSGSWPNWNFFFKFVYLAQEGISNVKTPVLGLHLPILAIYFLTIILSLNQIFVSKKPFNWIYAATAGLAGYGLMLFNYYISRSVSSNLPVVILPALLILIIFFDQLSNFKDNFSKLIKITIFISFIAIFCFSTYYLAKRIEYRSYAYNQVKISKKYPGNRAFYVVSYNEDAGRTVNELFESVSAIKKLSSGEKKILLFSQFDTVILVMAEKTQLLPVPMMEQFYYQSELEKAKKTLINMDPKPEYIFVDKNYPQFPTPSSYQGANELFEATKPFYQFDKTAGILEIYKLKRSNN